MMGRPTKLNDDVTKMICENIELGLSYSLAAQGAGITIPNIYSPKKEIALNFLNISAHCTRSEHAATSE